MLIVLVAFKDLAIFISFKINQTYIAENLCVNLGAPEVMCFGKCFLGNELKKSAENADNLPGPERPERSVFIFSGLLAQTVIHSSPREISPIYSYSDFFSNTSLDNVFHPPRTARQTA